MRENERPRARHRGLEGLATRQYGIVSARQLRHLGYSDDQIWRMAERGEIHPVHHGVYAVGHLHLSWEARVMAAVLAAEPGAMASHISAGWLWGLLGHRPGTIHITAPTRRHRRAGFRVHHAALADRDRELRDGIPVTSLARTLLDLAVGSRPGALERWLERADESGLLDLAQVDELLERLRGHRGRARLRRAAALYRPSGRVLRSDLEERFLAFLEDRGLPLPSTNVFVAGQEIDAYWPDARFGVELDSWEHHGSRAAFERDRLRDEEMRLAGIETIRVTDRRLREDPGGLAERIGRLLARERPGPRPEVE